MSGAGCWETRTSRSNREVRWIIPPIDSNKISQRDFELDLIDALEEEKRKQEKIRYTLAELAKMPDAELDFLVPGLTPRGEGTIITGPPKACKTLFTIDLIDSLLSGGSFMPCLWLKFIPHEGTSGTSFEIELNRKKGQN